MNEFAKRVALMFASSIAYGFTFTAGALVARKLAEKTGLIEPEKKKPTVKPLDEDDDL